jgi:hypothetical protein
MEELFPLESSWIVALAAGTLAIIMLLQLARSLPGQNIVLIAACLLAGEGLLDWLLAKFHLTPDVDGPVWYYVGGAALLWLAVVLFCRWLAQFILEPWRRERYVGLWVLAFSAVFTAMFQYGWPCFNPEPMNQKKAALVAAIRALATVIFLAGLSPWFIRKRPVSKKGRSKLAQQPENKAQ